MYHRSPIRPFRANERLSTQGMFLVKAWNAFRSRFQSNAFSAVRSLKKIVLGARIDRSTLPYRDAHPTASPTKLAHKMEINCYLFHSSWQVFIIGFCWNNQRVVIWICVTVAPGFSACFLINKEGVRFHSWVCLFCRDTLIKTRLAKNAKSAFGTRFTPSLETSPESY